VKGKTVSGDTVDEVRFVTPGNPTLYVAPGNYQVTLAASPLLATGDVYDTSQTANLDVSPTASQDEGRQATAPAEQSVTLELATKDSATVTDDDINSAIAYAKQASDDTSVDYSYDDDIVKAVTASLAEKRDVTAYDDVLEQYQSADAGRARGSLVNDAPYEEARAAAQNDAKALPSIPQADIQDHNLTVGALKYATDDLDEDGTAELLVGYTWTKMAQQSSWLAMFGTLGAMGLAPRATRSPTGLLTYTPWMGTHHAASCLRTAP
jgi:hypothetical protein